MNISFVFQGIISVWRQSEAIPLWSDAHLFILVIYECIFYISRKNFWLKTEGGLYLCDLMLSYLVIIWMYILYFQEEFLITDDLFVEYFNAFLALPVCTCDFFVSFGTKMLLNARHRYCFSGSDGSDRVAMSNFCD